MESSAWSACGERNGEKGVHFHCDLARVTLASRMGKTTPFTTHKKRRERKKYICTYQGYTEYSNTKILLHFQLWKIVSRERWSEVRTSNKGFGSSLGGQDVIQELTVDRWCCEEAFTFTNLFINVYRTQFQTFSFLVSSPHGKVVNLPGRRISISVILEITRNFQEEIVVPIPLPFDVPHLHPPRAPSSVSEVYHLPSSNVPCVCKNIFKSLR